ncbi:MAG: hypothetical protein ACQEW8_11985 [Actinomycetota bacterium]
MSDGVRDSWTTARLIEPSTKGFLYVGIRSGRWPLPPALPSAKRRRALRTLHSIRTALAADSRVERGDVLRGTLRPPGASRGFDGQHTGDAAYDAVLLIETRTPEDARELASDSRLLRIAAEFPDSLVFPSRNVRRIGPVDHERRGVFLFNYFTADDVAGNLHAWQYTAGWFQDETDLDNSTVLEPTVESPFTLVNHCRWDRYADVVPALIAKPSFRSFVLQFFAKNRVAPRPVLYALHTGRTLAP